MLVALFVLVFMKSDRGRVAVVATLGALLVVGVLVLVPADQVPAVLDAVSGMMP